MPSAAFTAEGSATGISATTAQMVGVQVTKNTTIDLVVTDPTGITGITWSVIGKSADFASPTITPTGVPSGVNASFTCPNLDGIAIGIRATAVTMYGTVTWEGKVYTAASTGVVPFYDGETGWGHALNDAMNDVATASGGVTAVLRASTATALAAILSSGTAAQPKRYRLLDTFVFDGILSLSPYSYVELDFTGCNITTTRAPDSSFADSVTNTLIYSSPTTANPTTLTATAKEGTYTLTVNSATGYATGSYTRTKSTNGANTPTGMSGDINDVYHIYKLTNVSGSNLTTEAGIRWWAYTGATSTVNELTAFSQGIKIIGGYWNCSGGTIACAISLDGVVGGAIEGCTFKGFSKSAVYLSGGTYGLNIDVAHDGECNAVIMSDSAHLCTVPKFRSPHTATAKKHTYGIQRALITLRGRSHGWKFGFLDLQWGSLGFQNWGSDRLYVEHIYGDNLDGSFRADHAGTDGMSGNQCGVVYDGGATSLSAYTSFGGGGWVNHIEVGSNLTFEAASTQIAVYWHDTHSCTLNGLTSVFNGDGAQCFDVLAVSDAFQGGINNIVLKGAQEGIRTENQACTWISNIIDENAAGSGSNSGRLFTFQHAGTGAGLQIANVYTSNRAALFAFTGGSFNNPNMEIRNFIYDEWKRPCDKMIVVLRDSAGGTAGRNELWEIYDTDSGYPMVRLGATGGLEKMVSICHGLNDTATNGVYLMGQLLGPGRAANISCTGAVNAGDRIRHGTTAGQGIADAAASSELILGRSLREVASGTNVIGVY